MPPREAHHSRGLTRLHLNQPTRLSHVPGPPKKPIGARKGNPYLVTALCNAATSAARTRGSFFKATYHRIKRRKGGGRATLAVAHKIAIAIYHMITRKTAFHDLGEHHNRTRDKRRAAKQGVRRLQKLGDAVILQPIHDAAAQGA